MLQALLLGTVSLLVAGDAKDDQKKLEGTWTVVSIEIGGQKEVYADPAKSVFTFAGDKLTNSKQGAKPIAMTYKLDPSKKPAAIDVTQADNNTTVLGIYALDGDTLKLCLPIAGDRPTEFATKKGSPFMVMELKRQKP